MRFAPLAAVLAVLAMWPVSAQATDYDVKPDGSGKFTTIQACANAAQPGDTCTVHPGTYREHVSVSTSGTSGQPITFRAVNPAFTTSNVALRSTMQGFRITGSYIVIDGFDMTRYNIGSDSAFIYALQTADNCIVTNNVIRDGTWLMRRNYVFDAAAHTITTATGGFLAAGFEVGTTVYVGGSINDRPLNRGASFTIRGLTDTVMTVDNADAIQSEGPVQSTIFANRNGTRDGVRAIELKYSSPTTPDNWLISRNKISNIAGQQVVLSGHNHRITQNTFDRVGGWNVFRIWGSNNLIDKNVLVNSPRWPGFPPPNQVTAASGYDAIDNIVYSSRLVGIEVNNIVFDSNVLLNMDNQLMSVADSPTTTSPASSGLTFSRNVFVGLELAGASQRPKTRFINNTFYGSTRSEGANFIVSNVNGKGTGEGSVIRNNAFIDNGFVPDPSGTHGWYSVVGSPIMEAPDWNYVAGSPASNYPIKAGFAGKEAHAMNGGDPMLQGRNGFKAGILAVAPISGASWTANTKTLTKAGAFASYTRVAGDTVRITSTSPTKQSLIFTVVSRSSADAIVLQEAGAGDSLLGDRSDVAMYPVAPTAVIVGPDATGLTMDDGLKPLAGSPLCNAGRDSNGNAVDIGAYSCAANKALVPLDGAGSDYTVSQAGGGDYTSITACAAVAQPGDTCTVFPGSYSEQVSTVRDGTSAAKITFKAIGSVLTKGFNVNHDHVVIVGFTVPEPMSSAGRVYAVSQAGSGDYTSIAACAAAAQPGDTCTVFSGSYDEQVSTVRNGTRGARITFKAVGSVVTKGFNINHEYVVIDGFTFAGSTSSTGMVYVNVGGNYCEVMNNSFGAGGQWTYGISIRDNPGATACSIHHNTFNGVRFVVLQTGGTNHVIEDNDFRALYYEDYVRPFGSGHTFRHNKFWYGILYTDGGHGHMDVQQVLHIGSGSQNILFEENIFADMPYPTTPGQFNIYSAPMNGVMYTDVGRHTYRRNMFANIYGNWSFSAPYATFEQNTFFAVAYGGSGIIGGNSLKGNSMVGHSYKGNAFIGGGNAPFANPGEIGWYSFAGSKLDAEPIDLRITHENVCPGYTCTGTAAPGTCPASNACKIYANLKANGYLDSAGNVTQKARGLSGSNPAEMDFDPALAVYKIDTYTNLVETATMDRDTRTGWVANYNFVSGSPGAGYPGKKTTGCDGLLTLNRFCEVNGINGGNPLLQAGAALSQGILAVAPFSSASWVASSKTLTKTGAFANYTPTAGDQVFVLSTSPSTAGGIYTVASKTSSDSIVLGTLLNGTGISDNRASVSVTPLTPIGVLLGPDGIPFTLDDGLKPTPSSPLCGKGSGGTDIGAYSCDPTKVFSTGGGSTTGVHPPTNFTGIFR